MINLAPFSLNEQSENFNKIFRQKEGSDFVSLRLTSKSWSFAGNIAREVKLSSLQVIPAEGLESFLKYAGLQNLVGKDVLSSEVPTTLKGVLQVQEANQPFREGQDPKINPSTGEVVEKNGEPVYRNTVYVSDPGAPEYVWGEVVEGRFTTSTVATEAVEEETPTA